MCNRLNLVHYICFDNDDNVTVLVFVVESVSYTHLTLPTNREV